MYHTVQLPSYPPTIEYIRPTSEQSSIKNILSQEDQLSNVANKVEWNENIPRKEIKLDKLSIGAHHEKDISGKYPATK